MSIVLWSVPHAAKILRTCTNYYAKSIITDKNLKTTDHLVNHPIYEQSLFYHQRHQCLLQKHHIFPRKNYSSAHVVKRSTCKNHFWSCIKSHLTADDSFLPVIFSNPHCTKSNLQCSKYCCLTVRFLLKTGEKIFISTPLTGNEKFVVKFKGMGDSKYD